MRGSRRSTAFSLGLLALLPASAVAQPLGGEGDSIVVIERGTPAVTGWDVAEAPFRLLTLPFFLLGRGAQAAVSGEGYLIPNILHTLAGIQARGVHPALFRQGPNSGVGAALLLGVPADRRGAWAHAMAGATVKEYWLLAVRAGRGPIDPEPVSGPTAIGDGRFAAQAFGFAAYRAEDEFYGLGHSSPATGRSDYDRERFGAGGTVAWRPRPQTELRLRGAWSEDAAGSGGDDAIPDVDATFPPGEIPGFGERQQYLSLGLAATWRGGHSHTVLRRGRWVRAGYTWNASQTDGVADYGHLEASAGLEIPVDRRRESFLLALRWEAVHPSGEGEVAFYRLPTLGGSRTLPAYRSERFRDRESLLGQLEYRYRVWSAPHDPLWFDTILFLYGGMVAEDLGRELALDRLKESWGVAFAFLDDRAEYGRITLAWGDDGFRARLLFGFGP